MTEIGPMLQNTFNLKPMNSNYAERKHATRHLFHVKQFRRLQPQQMGLENGVDASPMKDNATTST
jgi:hypothetical protein